MKISRLVIIDHQQFKHLDLDFTYPKGHEKEGHPLEKVCFIGRNGTGKTTLLKLLDSYFDEYINDKGSVFIKFSSEQDYYYVSGSLFNKSFIATQENEKWIAKLLSNLQDDKFKMDLGEILNYKAFMEDASKGNPEPYFNVVYSPSESSSNIFLNGDDLPKTNLNEALEDINHFNFWRNHEIISGDTLSNYWRTLIHHIKSRESDLIEFQNKIENQNKTIRQLNEEFDKTHPKILDEIARIWNRILDNAGMEFDVKGAKVPIQLTDNLKAYVKLKNNGEKVEYHRLSTGIRDYIFRIGHIYTFFINKLLEHRFAFIDEPENSLYPDFLYDLIETYQEVAPGSQMFFATHNPIIAAQFEPCERFILDFNDEGYVYARKGSIPLGDDPNDLLSKDFGVQNLMGKEGIEKWERFIELKRLIREEDNKDRKEALTTEFLEIGSAYNFDVD